MRPAPVKLGRQVSSSPVKFRQVLSSFVKPLLDGALCNFNDLPGFSLTVARGAKLGWPAPLRLLAGDETRIARLSPPARICPRRDDATRA